VLNNITGTDIVGWSVPKGMAWLGHFHNSNFYRFE
jgi:hypothetical protein